MNVCPPFSVDTFLPFMPDVGKCERSLHELNLMWRIIESSAKMNCAAEAKSILPAMAATRAGFTELEDELVESLTREKMGNVMAGLATKAQYVIDIVVRNLYERTADVGFLATDREVCAFVAGQNDDVDLMRLRLRAYRSKYTVYDEIMLLDLHGNVLVQIDDSTPIEGSHDPLIAATLASDSYVETFRACDLRPAKREALIYSRRVCHPDTGAVVGLLCLCFGFEEEMAGIFRTHSDQTERSNMLLLDADNRVLASADPLWMPRGAKVPVNTNGCPTVHIFGGRQYLVRSATSDGYQGYPGPAGWQGQVMIPLDVAFGSVDSTALANLEPAWADGLLSHARSFCPPLFEIMGAAEMIRRVVWNGQVLTAGRGDDLIRLKSILEQISETGARSNALFAQSIRDMFETVLATRLQDGEFVSHLLVDLLDRNLYERANDCRWWALSTELCTLLAGDAPDRRLHMERILGYINSLYTVYSTIFVYDRNGIVIASSGANTVEAIDSSTLQRVLALRGEQDYYVTPFEPPAGSDGVPTYVYHAAMRAPGRSGAVTDSVNGAFTDSLTDSFTDSRTDSRIDSRADSRTYSFSDAKPGAPIGGIGIVVNAQAEFDAMLRGALSGREEVQAFFIDRSATIIASTDASRPIGATLDIDPAMLAMPAGASGSCVLTHDDHYAVMGCTVSHGYREFKVSDGYRADVIAVVIESFGLVREGGVNTRKSVALLASDPTDTSSAEYATFFVDGELFAIDAEQVCEALPAAKVASITIGAAAERVGILEMESGAAAHDFVWVFDLGALLSGKPTQVDTSTQVVVVKHGVHAVGLLVSELHGVAKFEESQIIPTPLASIGGNGMLVKQVIMANEGSLLVQVVDTDYLFKMLKNPENVHQLEDVN
jgi:chemotaxis signal transduction protein